MESLILISWAIVGMFFFLLLVVSPGLILLKYFKVSRLTWRETWFLAILIPLAYLLWLH